MNNIFDDFESESLSFNGDDADNILLDLSKGLKRNPENTNTGDEEGDESDEPEGFIKQGVIQDNDFDILQDEDDEDNDEEEEVKSKPKADEEEDDEEEEDETNLSNEGDREKLFATFGEGLVKMGIFSKLEEGETWNEETWLAKDQERARNLAIKETEDFVREKHGELGYEIFKGLFIDGANPEEYLSTLKEERDIVNINIEDNESNQRYIVTQYLKKIGLEDSDIEENIDALIKTDKLEIKASIYKDKLVKDLEKQRALQAEQAAEVRKQVEADRKKYNEEVSKVISNALLANQVKNIPLSKTDSDLKDYILGQKYVLPNNQTISEFQKELHELQKDPESLVALAKLVKSKLDVSPIKKQVKSHKLDLNFEETKKSSGAKPSPNNKLDLRQLFNK